MFENPRRGGQARNFTINIPKILDLESSSEQIVSENCRRVPLMFIKSYVSIIFLKLLTNYSSWGVFLLSSQVQDQKLH